MSAAATAMPNGSSSTSPARGSPATTPSSAIASTASPPRSRPARRRALTFTSRIWHRGFRAGSPATDVIENGTFVNNFDFAPIIGMSRQGLLSDRAQRRRQGLPAELRMAKLEDASAIARNYIGTDWVNVRHHA